MLSVQLNSFHPEQACFDSYLHFEDNTALFTLDGYIFTLICIEVINGHFGHYATVTRYIPIRMVTFSHIHQCVFLSAVQISSFLHENVTTTSCTSNGMLLTLAHSIHKNSDMMSKCTHYCVGVYFYQLAFFSCCFCVKSIQ